MGAQPDMELRQLIFFVAVAEELHFNRAAVRMHIAQAALSSHIQALEKELGVRLLERSTRRVELTRADGVFGLSPIFRYRWIVERRCCASSDDKTWSVLQQPQASERSAA